GRGAVTWGSGSTGVSGTISDANSLVGSDPGDGVGYNGITLLSNGNYVILSPPWNGRRGAATWANGSTGISGTISAANSLIGSPGGAGGVSVYSLNYGNNVLQTPNCDDGREEVNRGSGSVVWGRSGS